MKPSVKVRRSRREGHPWVNFVGLKAGEAELCFAPAYYRTFEAAVRTASIRADQLKQLVTDQEEHS